MGAFKRIYTGLITVVLCTACSSTSSLPTSTPCSNRYDSFDITALFLPAIMSESYALREYIRNCMPHTLFGRVAFNDDLLKYELHTVDQIYLHALRLTNGDYADALFICTLGTLTHKNIPFSFGIRFPLTTESDSLYIERTVRLPHMVFCDTPAYGDADKLQHFFGSAYATITADGDALPDVFGIVVELSESGFVEQENYDSRDVRTNRLGQLFAQRLHENPDILPSQIFGEWNEQHN